MQHAPLGTMHRPGVQAEPTPFQVPPAPAQAAALETWMHSPLVRQHAPGGVGHVPTPQLVESPWYVPPVVEQFAALSTWQVPFDKQHAPVGGAVLDPTKMSSMNQFSVVLATFTRSRRRNSLCRNWDE